MELRSCRAGVQRLGRVGERLCERCSRCPTAALKRGSVFASICSPARCCNQDRGHESREKMEQNANCEQFLSQPYPFPEEPGQPARLRAAALQETRPSIMLSPVIALNHGQRTSPPSSTGAMSSRRNGTQLKSNEAPTGWITYFLSQSWCDQRDRKRMTSCNDRNRAQPCGLARSLTHRRSRPCLK